MMVRRSLVEQFYVIILAVLMVGMAIGCPLQLGLMFILSAATVRIIKGIWLALVMLPVAWVFCQVTFPREYIFASDILVFENIPGFSWMCPLNRVKSVYLLTGRRTSTVFGRVYAACLCLKTEGYARPLRVHCIAKHARSDEIVKAELEPVARALSDSVGIPLECCRDDGVWRLSWL
jgi:hypothetical protein